MSKCVLYAACGVFLMALGPASHALDIPDDPNFVEYRPGMIVVKFDLPVERIQFKPGPTAHPQLGIASLDAIAAKYKVTSITPMFPGAEIKEYQGRTIDLTRYYKVRFDESVDLDDIIADYSRDASVELVEANAIYRADVAPNDPRFADQWYHWQAMDHDIDTPQAWDIETGNANIIVAIIDTGVLFFHKDLGGANASYTSPEDSRGNMWINYAELNGQSDVDDDGNGWVDDWIGWDFYQDTNDPSPIVDAHGTAVAGVVAAITNDGFGIAGVAGGWHDGTMPVEGNGVRIMAIKQYEGGFSPISCAEGLFYASQNGARIANISSSFYGGTPQVFQDAACYFMATGGLIFTSAGNKGNSQTDWMGLRSDIMAVAATDENDNRWTNSSYGGWVEVSAPGKNIWTTWYYSGNPGGNLYAEVSGTSLSSPIAAAVAALIWSQHPEWSADQVRRRLLNTADNIDDFLDPWLVGQMGAGRVNAVNAVGASTCDNEAAMTFAGGGFEQKAFGIGQNNPGNIAIAGYQNTGYPDNVVDCYIACFDSCGGFRWGGTYGDTVAGGQFYKETGRDVAPAQQNGFVIVGESRVNELQAFAYYLALDSAGNELASRRISRPGEYGEANAVVQASDSGHVIAGYTQAYTAQKDILVIKVTAGSGGDTAWTLAIGDGSRDEIAHALEATSDGGYIIGGSRQDDSGLARAYLVKVDSQFTTEWTGVFGGGEYDEYIRSVRELAYGGYLMLVTTYSDTAGEYRAAVIRTDPDGDSLWSIVHSTSADLRYTGLDLTDDGGYVTSCNAYLEAYDVDGTCFVKYDPFGNLVGSWFLWDNYSTANILDIKKSHHGRFLGAGFHGIDFAYDDPNQGPQSIDDIDAALGMSLLQENLGKIIINVPGDAGTIQEAIDLAWDDWRVEVSPGTYTGEGNRNISFMGKAIEVVSTDGPEVTIIDCQDSARGFIFDSAETEASILSGFTIANGNASGSVGGGIFVSLMEDSMRLIPSHPTITDCIIRDCQANTGGGIYVSTISRTDIRRCTIVRNTAAAGAGIAYEYSTTNNEFDQNIVALNNGEGLRSTHPISSTSLSYSCNVFWENSGGNVVNISGSGVDNATADPWFCDLDGNDFKVWVYSPCTKHYSLCDEYIGAVDDICETPFPNRGDVDLDSYAFEANDLQILRNWFDDGDTVFTVDVDSQRLATDINCDGYLVTAADYLSLRRIVNGQQGSECPGFVTLYNGADTIKVLDVTAPKGQVRQGVDVYVRNCEYIYDFQMRIEYDISVLVPHYDDSIGDGKSVEFELVGRGDDYFNDSTVIVKCEQPGEILVYFLSPMYGNIGLLDIGGGTILRIFFDVKNDPIMPMYTPIGPVDDGYYVNQFSYLNYKVQSVVPELEMGTFTIYLPSCPVLYADDGTGPVEENPLLTACEQSGYTRVVTDYYHVRAPLNPVDGRLNFQLRELEDEITYLHDFELITVDHPDRTRVACTVDGDISLYSEGLAPVSAVDHRGVDRLAAVVADDGLLYSCAEPGHLIVTFPDPGVAGDRFQLFAGSKPKPCFPIEPPDTLPKNAVVDPGMAEVTVEIPDGNGEWRALDAVPSRDHTTLEVVGTGPISGPDAEVITLRVSWRRTYTTDAILRIVPLEISPRVTTWRREAFAFKAADLTAAAVEGFGPGQPLVLTRGDMAEFTFGVDAPRGENSTRDYIIRAVGRYQPDYAVYAEMLPDRYQLFANYPNPFNAATTICYDLPEQSAVTLAIYNVLGQHVTTLVDGRQEAGRYQVTWDSKDQDGRTVASGIYFYRLTTDRFTDSRKMVLLK